MHPKQLSTKEALLELQSLRHKALDSVQNLEDFMNKLEGRDVPYSLGHIDGDSLQLLNRLKIQYATEELFSNKSDQS